MSTTAIKSAIVLLSFLTFTTQASWNDLNFSAGIMDPMVGQIQTSASGDTNKMDFKPLLEISGSYALNESWHLIPSFGFMLPGDTDTRDDNITKLSYYFLANGAYIWNDFSFRAGTGLYITYIKGSGGTENLPNGLGVDSFPVPDESANTTNIVLSGGASYKFHENFSTKFETMLFNTLSSRNKAVSYSLVATYHFNDSLWGK